MEDAASKIGDLQQMVQKEVPSTTSSLGILKNNEIESASGYDEQVEYIKTIHGDLSQITGTSRVQSLVQEIINNGINMTCDVSAFVEKQTEQTTETSQMIPESLDKFYSEIILPFLLRQTEMSIVLENAKNQLGIADQKIIKKLTEMFEENLKIKEELKNIEESVSNRLSDIAEQIKYAEEARSQALSEAVKQKDASAVLSLSVSAKNKADVDCKEFITKQLQNFEHTAVGSQPQFQSMNDNLQTLTHKSQDLNDIIKDSVQKLRKSMAEHLVQYKEYIEKEEEEFLDAKKHVTSWKESTSSLLEESENSVNKLLDEDLKHDIPTGGTPQRKDYHFPTDLVGTPPAE